MTETLRKEVGTLLQILGYDHSPHYIRASSLTDDPDYGHIYRKAQAKCSLHGVYQLRGTDFKRDSSNVPVIYVCSASSEEDADEIHRLVWNQNIVPFLLVVCPRNVRLYSGFRYGTVAHSNADSRERGLLIAGVELAKAADILRAFSAESVDQGKLWEGWSNEVTPEYRVDWTLLKNLEQLGQVLHEGGLDNSLAHALIGKFVYLHYLRARHILSDRRLNEWGLSESTAFGRDVSINSFSTLLDHLQAWLNGSVFPISNQELRNIGLSRLRLVASVFLGDTPAGQTHLNFEAYDFSFIPIETLSVIYEQFLHSETSDSGQSRGREGGAYYTPVPLVNFIIDEMERRKPLKVGMRVLDPACGSGVFLVQCFRKLIELKIKRAPAKTLRPVELREILVKHIFGIDIDSDACRVAELSLILTLLDYVDPPDLKATSNFKLPALRDENLFCGDAFDTGANWHKDLVARPFDWIVGNPPWKNLSSLAKRISDKLALVWMKQNSRTYPVGGNQVAEAFAWLSLHFGRDSGISGLLLPASILFKHESREFRKRFFSHVTLWSVANFANFAEVLFGGRSRVPAAALFFACAVPPISRESVEVYSPLLANQTISHSRRSRKRQETWCILVNAGELREVPYQEAVQGEALPWKLAMWGSPLDRTIIRKTEQRFDSLDDLRKTSLYVAEGFQLRTSSASNAGLEAHPELAGRLTLNVKRLKKLSYLYKLPANAFLNIARENTFVRKRGGYKIPLEVCSPPHILVGASRTFFVLSNEFVVLPPRQIGIRHRNDDAEFLKALTLYLNSDFALYHQFLTSPEVKRPVATLKSLLRLPVPFSDQDRASLREWAALYDEIGQGKKESNLFEDLEDSGGSISLKPFMEQINKLAFAALRLDPRLQASVQDLIHTKRYLVDGQIGEAAVKRPDDGDIKSYLSTLQTELDNFLGNDVSARHRIAAIRSDDAGMVELELIPNTSESQPATLLAANETTAALLSSILNGFREKRSQWVYFDRNVRLYKGASTYLLKPMQRLHWTSSQAVADAQIVIAETICQRTSCADMVHS